MTEEKAVYFITADDEFTAANRAREIFDAESKNVEDELSKEIINGSSSRADEAIAAIDAATAGAATLSLFGGKKVVWLKNVNFIYDDRSSKSAAVTEALAKFAEFLKSIPASSAAVIISASPIDRRKKFFKELQKFAECEDFTTGKDPIANCAAAVEIEAKKLGIKLDSGAAETLSGIVAGNPRMAFQEVLKLSNFAGEGGTITENDVLEMVPVFGEGDFFEISNSFYSGNLEEALAKLSRFFFTNKNASARPIISTIQKQNSVLIQLRALIDSGLLPRSRGALPRGAIEKAYSRYEKYFSGIGKSSFNVFAQNPWYVGSRLAPIAARIPLRRLIDIQIMLVHAFEELISRGSSADESVLRDFFARAMSK